MTENRYILEPYKGMNTRYCCPSCKHNGTLSLYIDTQTGEHLSPSVGRCNRESNCGYHYTPKQYFEDNDISVKKENIITQLKDKITFEFEYSENIKNAVKRISNCKFDSVVKQWYVGNSIITEQIRDFSKEYNFTIIEYKPQQPKTTKSVSIIPVEVFKQSLQIEKNVSQVANTNHFIKFLINLFGVEVTCQLISSYFIATSKHWDGATVFWQIDTQGNIRTGKIMLYDATTGKRVKEPYNHITWVHKALNQSEFELKQCLFGEHLLQDKTKPVAIVESEKTALISSVYLPQFIWLAVGSLNNLNAEKCSVLKGRTVTLFPDLNGFEKWNNKANELSNLAIFTVSDLLERKATEAERNQGFDLADYLIKFDYRDFILNKPKPIYNEQPKITKPLVEVEQFEQIEKKHHFSNPEKPKPENWEQEINDLEHFFKTAKLPSQPVKLNPFSTITDLNLFIESHIETVKANNGKHTFLPYLNRLQELKQYITNNLN